MKAGLSIERVVALMAFRFGDPSNVAGLVSGRVIDEMVSDGLVDDVPRYAITRAGRLALDAHYGWPHAMADAPDDSILVYAAWQRLGMRGDVKPFAWRVAARDDVDGQFYMVSAGPNAAVGVDPLGWLPLPDDLEEEVR